MSNSKTFCFILSKHTNNCNTQCDPMEWIEMEGWLVFHESPSSIIQMLQTMNVTISIASHKWIPIIVFLWVLSIF